MEIALYKKPDKIKLQTKTTSIIINSEEAVKADIVLFTDKTKAKSSDKSDQKIFSTAGEYEVNTVAIYGVDIGDNTSFVIQDTGVSTVCLDYSFADLSDDQIERLNPADILILVSVKEGLENKVPKLISVLEPKAIVIAANDTLAKSISQELGISIQKEAKIKFTSKDMLLEGQKLVELKPAT